MDRRRKDKTDVQGRTFVGSGHAGGDDWTYVPGLKKKVSADDQGHWYRVGKQSGREMLISGSAPQIG